VAVVGQTRIELGFIGAHADIGGGFAANNELAQVALSWMVEQAKSAGVSMLEPRSDIIANPVIHDKSDNQYCTNGPGCAAPNGEDRQVRYRGGATTTQRNMVAAGTGMSWQDTQLPGNSNATGPDQQPMISYAPPGIDGNGVISRNPAADASTGTVNMTRYLQWLRDHGYNLGNLQVQ
jgi:Uncharacterized alpha/beta hydrolase domain (DUF2235)